MSQVKGRFIEPDSVTASRILLNNNTSLRSVNAANTGNVNLLKLDSSNILQIETQAQISTTPTAATDLTNKNYVDTAITNASSTWLQAALDGPINTPPVSPSVGDRYLIGTSPSGVWTGKANQEAIYTALGWSFIVPTAGNVLNVNTYTAGFYYYTGSAWVTRDFEKTTASLGLIKVGADIQPNFEVSNPTLKNASGYLAVNLDGSRAITTGTLGIGVNVEASSPSLQILGNELGIKFDAAGALQKTASGVSVKIESSNPTLQIATNQLGVKLDPAGAVVTGAAGVSVSLEASNPSLQIATNQLGVKLDPAGAVIKGATGVAVQLESSNPTLQIATNRLGVKLNASGALITGSSGLLIQVDNATLKINGSNQLEGLKPKKEIFTLTGTNITNGYIDLTQLAYSGSTLVFVNGLLQNETSDYTVSTVSSVSRITFTGDLTASATALVAGDKIVVSYSYL